MAEVEQVLDREADAAGLVGADGGVVADEAGVGHHDGEPPGSASVSGVAISARTMTRPSIAWWESRATAAETSPGEGLSRSTSVTV